MSTARTLNCPPITLGKPKSVITRLNTTKAAETIPYLAPGIVTVQKVFHAEAFKETAASYKRASEIARAVDIIKNACGKVKNTDPIMIPIGP